MAELNATDSESTTTDSSTAKAESSSTASQEEKLQEVAESTDPGQQIPDDGPDTQPPAADDTSSEPPRRLRRDAESDPMADQTEPTGPPSDREARRVADAQRQRLADTQQETRPPPRTSPPPGDPSNIPRDADPVQARSPVDADPGATTNVTRGELLGTEEVQSYLDETGLRPDEIRFQYQSGIGGDTGNRFAIVPTESGQERLAVERREAAVVDVGQSTDLAAADINRRIAGGEFGGSQQRAPRSADLAVAKANRDLASQRDAIAAEIESDLEQAIGQRRASAAGDADQGQYRAIAGSVDLELGEDFTLDISPTDEGFRIEADLTESFRQAEAERTAEIRLGRVTGADLEAGEDFRLVEGEGGGFAVELTESGERAVATEGGNEQFGDIDWSGVFGIDTAASDLVDQEVSEDDLRAAGVDPSTVNKPTGEAGVDEVEQGLAGVSYEVSQAGEEASEAVFKEGTFFGESALARLMEISPTELSDTVPTEADLRAAGIDPSTVLKKGDPEQAQRFESDIRNFGKGTLQGTVAIANVPALAGGVLEGVEYGAYATERPASETLAQTGERGTEVVQEADEFVTENPARAAGLGVGSLAASFGIMQAARKLSPSAGLASRYAIQPGEELAGSVGHRVTRAAAGERRAQQLFPNKEPLIFSEEAAIRTARRLKARAGPTVSEARDILGRTEVSGRPGVGLGGLRVEVEKPKETTESRYMAEELDRMEAAYAQKNLPSRDPAFGGTGKPNTVESIHSRRPDSSPAFEGPELEFESEVLGETESDPLTRLEIAQQSSVQTDPLNLARTRGRTEQVEMAETRSDLLNELGLDQEIDTEVETDLEQELLLEPRADTPLDLELELEVEGEFESEFEMELESLFEVEAEPILDRPRDRPSKRRDRDVPGWSRRVERDLLNPFTGR